MNSYSCALYPTVITPFKKDKSIDYASLGRLLARFAQNGCDGVFAVCQSSEMFFLTDDEITELAGFSIKACHDLGMKCVVSGHIHSDIDAQTRLFRRLEALSPDAIILVLNRLAEDIEDDSILITNLKRLTSALSDTTRLGVYECPYPYKRLLSRGIIEHMKTDRRFEFIKDTCCDIELIRERLNLLRGGTIKLFNANAATLFESLQGYAAGYSGVMLNFIPEIFAQLKASLEGRPQSLSMAEAICAHISAASIVECQNYPANAKYYNSLLGIADPESLFTRTPKPPLSASQKGEIKDFLTLNSKAYFSFTRHDAGTLIFGRQAPFKSCHASTVLPLADGSVLAAYFAGDYESADNVGIWLSRRSSGAWLPPVRIAKVNDTAHWNPVLFETPQGARAVFKVGKSTVEWESYTMLSGDGGASWLEPQKYENQDGCSGPVRSKPITLSNGLMLAPNSIETNEAWKPRVDASNDYGKSFYTLAQIPVNATEAGKENYISGEGAIQPTLWESENGCVHALLRTTCGFIYRSDSADFGKTWCMAYNTGLPNNNSGIDIEKAGDTLYLAMNPVSGDRAKRTPLVIMKSTDNGQSFSHFITLADAPTDGETGNDAEFSYPSIVHRNGVLYISYTHLRRGIAFHEIAL